MPDPTTQETQPMTTTTDAPTTLLEMPRGYYAEDRARCFELLAQSTDRRPLEVRVALSNVFVAMTNRRRLLHA
jgi:hypothetical protein